MARIKKTTLPRPLTKEAQAKKEEFDSKYEAYLAESMKVALSVLVWGSAPEGKSPAAKKRRDIRDALIEAGHYALFSEEISTPGAGGLAEKSKEFAQAKAADMIIILIEDAVGATAEVHDFGNDPAVAGKVYVMAPKKYRDGYSAKGALRDLDDAFGGVFWYDENDMIACEVLAQALRKVEARRQIQYRAGGKMP